MIVLGIDPGSQTTGWAIRDHNQLLAHGLIHRGTDTLERYMSRTALTLGLTQQHYPAGIIAIEDVTAPNVYHQGKRQMIHPGSQIDTAKVAGYIAGYIAANGHHIVWVPPGGNGSHPLGTYPPALVGTRERSGTGQLRHARSAWDIAATGQTIHTTKGTP